MIVAYAMSVIILRVHESDRFGPDDAAVLFSSFFTAANQVLEPTAMKKFVTDAGVKLIIEILCPGYGIASSVVAPILLTANDA